MTEKDTKPDFAYTGYNRRLVPNARELRKNMTKQEKHLWYDFLNTYPIKFYRQRPIGYYIADFYCSKAKLVVEIDGSQHFTLDGMEYDKLRTEIINLFNVEVIRFTNNDIDKNFDGVCKMIDLAIKKRMDCIENPSVTS